MHVGINKIKRKQVLHHFIDQDVKSVFRWVTPYFPDANKFACIFKTKDSKKKDI